LSGLRIIMKLKEYINQKKMLLFIQILNIDNNPKTIKGQSQKVMTAILYLAPAKISGFNVCPFADDCALTC
jgi:hypothetical protein